MVRIMVENSALVDDYGQMAWVMRPIEDALITIGDSDNLAAYTAVLPAIRTGMVAPYDHMRPATRKATTSKSAAAVIAKAFSMRVMGEISVCERDSGVWRRLVSRSLWRRSDATHRVSCIYATGWVSWITSAVISGLVITGRTSV